MFVGTIAGQNDIRYFAKYLHCIAVYFALHVYVYIYTYSICVYVNAICIASICPLYVCMPGHVYVCMHVRMYIYIYM